MTDTAPTPFPFRGHALVASGDGQATALPLDDTFWPSLMAGRIAPDWLMLLSDMASDMGHWEMHPDGDEIFCLLCGHLMVVMDDGAGEHSVELDTGPADAPVPQGLVMPRGTWHRFEVRRPGRLLFLTWGKGTRHRPL